MQLFWEAGKLYTAQVFDLAGRFIHSQSFTADGADKTMQLHNSIPAGIYMISVLQKDTQTAGYVKVAKDF